MDGEISTADLAALLPDGARVIDVRDRAAFRRGHLPGSECVPLPELVDRAPEFAGAERVVTVCPHGEASVQAARLLAAYEGLADARIESLAGGLTAWRRDHDLVRGREGDRASGAGERADGDVDAPF
ncbi:MAG: rhodanese-like domain-containing protein [Halobacteriaceae archaeon]